MKQLGSIRDPSHTNRAYTSLDNFFLRFIKDERDLPFVYLALRITFIVVPLALLLYMPFVTGGVWWAVAAIHFYVTNFVFKGPFGLMLHCTSHRQFFKNEYQPLNKYLPWVLAPFFGHSPETY